MSGKRAPVISGKRATNTQGHGRGHYGSGILFFSFPASRIFPAIRSLHYVIYRTGRAANLHLHQLSNIAWSFAQEGYTDPQGFCVSVAGLAHAVEQLALEISTYEWSWWIKAYQEDEEERRLAAEEDELRREHISHCSENGTEYQSLPYRSYSMDGIVYLPVIVPETGNFEVGCRGDECAIAIVPLWTDAVAIARYAVSHNGGYGSVIVRSTDKSITHADFKTWFLD